MVNSRVLCDWQVIIYISTSILVLSLFIKLKSILDNIDLSLIRLYTSHNIFLFCLILQNYNRCNSNYSLSYRILYFFSYISSSKCLSVVIIIAKREQLAIILLYFPLVPLYDIIASSLYFLKDLNEN